MIRKILRRTGRVAESVMLRALSAYLTQTAGRRDGRAPFAGDELRLVYDALRSQHLGGTNGKMVEAFEAAFAAAYGVPYAVASTSGTAAVHVALGALDLNPGDEIIVPPITDMGTIIPILYQNAIPVFADVDETYNMDPREVERRITPRTRAIIVVHLFGNPCDIDAMLAIARHHGVALIEDSSQAHLTQYRGRYAGTVGDIGCFSFQQSKPMTTGEGGMTITWNKAHYDRMKLFADKGFARKGWGPRAYLFHAPNYRITELVAAVGLAQLRKVRRNVAKRAELGRYMTERLAGLEGVIPAPVTPGAEHTYWQYPVRLSAGDPQALAAALRAAGIPSLPGYTGKPIYLCSDSLRAKKTYGSSQFPFGSDYEAGAHTYDEGLCPNAERLLDHLLTIQWDESWSRRDVDRAVEIIGRTLSAGETLPVRPEGSAVPAVASSAVAARPDGRRLRIAIIGCGRVGQWHVNAYRKQADAEITAVADVDFALAQTVAAKTGAKPYRSHSELLRAEALDGASICSVPASHREIAVDLLRAGVHVLCEKPLATTVADLQAMLEAARTADRMLVPAFKYRFHEEIETTKELLATGGFGRVLTFRIMFGAQTDMGGTWYVRPEISGGGVLMDNGPHALDLVRFLFGEISEITAEASESQSYGVEDTGTLAVRLESGGVGTIDLSWAMAVPSRTYLEIFGENGTILADVKGLTHRFKAWDDWKRIDNRTNPDQAFARQVAHFLGAIRRTGDLVVTPDDGLKTQLLIDAAYDSIRRGKAREVVRA